MFATNWIKDRPEGLKVQNLALATKTGPAMSSSPKHMKADVQLAINKCESLGSGKQLILHGNPSAIAKDFSPHVAVLRRLFLPNMQFECCMFSRTLSEASSTSLRPAVNPRLGASLENPCTSFDPCAWTMIVFWKENSGRQPQIITSENERGDETNCTSPPTFFDDPDVPFGPSGPPGPPELPGPPGPPPGWPPVSGGRVGPRRTHFVDYGFCYSVNHSFTLCHPLTL